MQPLTFSPRTSRVYLCSSCGAGTEINGNDFRGLTNPCSFATATICAGCGEVPLDLVYWPDTQETVANYRRRLAQRVPIWVMRMDVMLALFGALILGVNAALHNASLSQDAIAAGVGALIGFIVGFVIKATVGAYALGIRWWEVD